MAKNITEAPCHQSDHHSVTDDTLLVLEAAADDDTDREEEDGGDDAAAAEVVLNITTTVGTAVPGRTRCFFVNGKKRLLFGSAPTSQGIPNVTALKSAKKTVTHI